MAFWIPTAAKERKGGFQTYPGWGAAKTWVLHCLQPLTGKSEKPFSCCGAQTQEEVLITTGCHPLQGEMSCFQLLLGVVTPRLGTCSRTCSVVSVLHELVRGLLG